VFYHQVGPKTRITDGYIIRARSDTWVRFDQSHIDKSVALVEALVQKETESIDSSKIFIAGLMDGVSIALTTWLRSSHVLGGVHCYQGVLTAKIDWDKINVQDKKKTPVEIFSGEEDGWMRQPFVKRIYDHLVID